MISSGRHPKKEIADALRCAKDAGLVVIEIHRGHRWGEVMCSRCGQTRAVYSTPRNPGGHANRLGDFIRLHTDCREPSIVVEFRRRKR